MRKKMKRSKDRKIFSHTAVIGKKVNVEPRMSRGGVRL